MCLCPAHADRTPSLSLRQGDKGILVTCFAGCQREDVLRELRRVPIRGHFTYRASPAPRSGSASRLWGDAMPVEGTLAQRYLESRGLWPTTDDLRFHPRCPYRPRPWTTFHPALLVAVREGQHLTAIQRILLDPVTATYRMKLMLGRPRQGAWQGGGQGRGVLALAEGFETARAFSILTGVSCWASLGTRRLDQILLPGSLTKLILAADNDAEGMAAADRAMLYYARPGLEISRMIPEDVKDWAKALEVASAKRH